MFTYSSTVQLHQTDGAGIVFFGNYFAIAHDAYQALMASLGFDFRTILDEGEFLALIVHAEADYKQPLQVQEHVTTVVSVERLGETSYTLAYSIRNGDDSEVATARTVHVAINRETGKKIRLPKDLRAGLNDL